MLIEKKTFWELKQAVFSPPPEIGGILGGKNDIVSFFKIDIPGEKEARYCEYHPNVDYLNSCIEFWINNGIEFLGVFHTHFPGGYELSKQDRSYIKQIVMSMPQKIRHLYFHVFCSGQLIGYRATRYLDSVHISCDDIKII